MLTVLRGITTVGLCLFLALTSVALAVARGAPGAEGVPEGVMVICTGDGVSRIAVAADGQPAAPPQICPDCLLAFHATVPNDPLPALAPARITARHPFAHARHAAAATRPMMRARAPPPAA